MFEYYVVEGNQYRSRVRKCANRTDADGWYATEVGVYYNASDTPSTEIVSPISKVWMNTAGDFVFIASTTAECRRLMRVVHRWCIEVDCFGYKALASLGGTIRERGW